MSSSPENKVNKRKLWLLMSVFSLPIILSVIFYQFAELRPSGTISHGHLVRPAQPLNWLPMKDIKQTQHDEKLINEYWTLLTISSSLCDKICQNNLYVMRQVHLSQGDQLRRVRRLWVVTDAVNPEKLSAEITDDLGLLVIPNLPQSLLQQFALSPKKKAVKNRLYLIDTNGNLMM